MPAEKVPPNGPFHVSLSSALAMVDAHRVNTPAQKATTFWNITLIPAGFRDLRKECSKTYAAKKHLG